MSSRYSVAFSCTLLLLVAMPLSQPAHAQRAEIFQSGEREFGLALAVGGYDAVAYQTQNRPVAGTPDYRISWKGAEWRFASVENRDAFARDPQKYAPQFGGYCAFAVAHGSTSAGDPKVFSVVDGKLYLNLNAGVQSSWRRDQANLIRRGEANWPGVLK